MAFRPGGERRWENIYRIAAVVCVTMMCVLGFTACPKKEDDTSTNLLILFAYQYITGFNSSCDQRSINFKCANAYGTIIGCTTGIFSTIKCPGTSTSISNYGSCRSSTTEQVYYPGVTTPCTSAGTCQTYCINLGAIYTATTPAFNSENNFAAHLHATISFIPPSSFVLFVSFRG